MLCDFRGIGGEQVVLREVLEEENNGGRNCPKGWNLRLSLRCEGLDLKKMNYAAAVGCTCCVL